MKLYDELADWWPVFSDQAAYRREASHFIRLLRKTTRPVPRTLLELGSGGGNSAFHLKSHFEMTLVDMSPRMLRVSRRLNPECEHIMGDIRRVRLGRQFDAVFVHDAICHMITEADLLAGFLQWVADPDPADTTYVVDFAILIRDRRGRTRVEHDRHVLGLFPRARWLRLLREVGFKASVVRDGRLRDAFLGRRPSGNARLP